MFNENRSVRSYNEIDVVRDAIDKANSIKLFELLQSYDVNVGYRNNTYCPFPFHKNGNERSASFNFYPNTNSFYCWGCKTGGRAVDFISRYKSISRYDAALEIINEYSVGDVSNIERVNNYYPVYAEFSNLIREFIIEHSEEPKALEHAEYICSALDSIRSKHYLDINALNMVLTKLRKKLADYEWRRY